jgi:hypothetical protein
MNGKRKAQIVTAALVTALGVALVMKTRPGSDVPAAIDPQGAIYAMLDAARAGEVRTYLTAFTGQMETTLRQTLAETTELAFAKYLRESNATIKGIVVGEPQKISDREVTVRVEYVYQDRNEAQTMYLEKGPRGWKISRADADERVKTLVPYGTPVK